MGRGAGQALQLQCILPPSNWCDVLPVFCFLCHFLGHTQHLYLQTRMHAAAAAAAPVRVVQDTIFVVSYVMGSCQTVTEYMHTALRGASVSKHTHCLPAGRQCHHHAACVRGQGHGSPLELRGQRLAVCVCVLVHVYAQMMAVFHVCRLVPHHSTLECAQTASAHLLLWL